MDDNYFDDKLKNILESAPDFSMDRAAEQDMLGRLRASQSKKRRPWGLPLWLALALLPSMVFGSLFYQKYSTLDRKIVELNQVLTTVNQTDTILQTKIIYQYDTIHTVVYREKYIRANKSYESIPWMSTATSFGNRYPYTDLRTLNSDRGLGESRLSLLAKNPGSGLFLPSLKMEDEIPEEDLKWVGISWLDRLSPDELQTNYFKNIDDLANLPEDWPSTPRSRINPMYYFSPTGFEAGIGFAPVVFPQNEYGSGANLFALSAELLLPGNRSLSVGLELLKMNFEIKDPLQFNDFPVVDPTDPADVLAELKGNFSYLQIPVSLKQRFLKDQNFQPTLSIGFVAYKPLRQNFEYEYLDGGMEYKLSSTLKQGAFSADNLRIGLGGQYRLWDKLIASADVHYQHGLSLNTNEYYRLRYWAANIGIRYKL